MALSDKTLGLRERKKLRTRATIRREAFRLIQERGYQATTVEQISAAADISPRTFSRYFPTKEAVLISDDHIPPIIDAFVAAPADMSVIDAYRHAVETTFNSLTPEQREEAVIGQRLMYTVPEVAGLLYAEYVRLIGLIEDALTQRPGAPADPRERRVLAGAIVGVLIGASHGTPLPGDPISDSLQVLDRLMK
ncbi:TetR family transcriptional regulator [Mycobacterium sp. 852002-51152_SCH6134967]|uniref:TetR family transcriptional regulator n=1 Tax=Mycobacterium sp. 852002-51152_SCH6134967 TaxID=1834096 RepID=UPI0008013146|nr:TetR family transcriptional regulator [Mycobacterium sp. 852002-51152_SCH6134967]OBF91250.1 TetR family transcriptional regulator [Mycobacterium sp. 852002-51152_SCH6134967]